jgi:diacylglycerol kinase family enzyme
LEFLGKTHFRWEVIRTEYRGHCQEYLEKIQNPEEFYGVVIISGDGLMHEFVNSLVQIPVVHVPAGSGNAFARTQAQEAGENCGTKENLYMAIKGQTKRFSLTKYTL